MRAIYCYATSCSSCGSALECQVLFWRHPAHGLHLHKNWTKISGFCSEIFPIMLPIRKAVLTVKNPSVHLKIILKWNSLTIIQCHEYKCILTPCRRSQKETVMYIPIITSQVIALKAIQWKVQHCSCDFLVGTRVMMALFLLHQALVRP